MTRDRQASADGSVSVARVMELPELRARGVDDVLLFAGGIIPEVDIPAVREVGFAAVFGPGTDTGDIVAFVREHAPRRA